MEKYIISDTHFNHENIIKYCNRPFSDINNMNKKIIENWNDIVTDEDIIYHLGDFLLGSKYDLMDIISKLKGHIYLVRGNHDRLPVGAYIEAGIVVLKNPPIKIDDYKFLLTHRPLSNMRIDDDYINLHGHIHNTILSKKYDSNKHMNVSCDVTGFKPLLLKKIKK